MIYNTIQYDTINPYIIIIIIIIIIIAPLQYLYY